MSEWSSSKLTSTLRCFNLLNAVGLVLAGTLCLLTSAISLSFSSVTVSVYIAYVPCGLRFKGPFAALSPAGCGLFCLRSCQVFRLHPVLRGAQNLQHSTQIDKELWFHVHLHRPRTVHYLVCDWVLCCSSRAANCVLMSSSLPHAARERCALVLLFGSAGLWAL